MALVINTNVQSLNAQRNLASSQSAMTTALQRLSSGLRINSAKDDAAGLAISNRFTTQIRGLNQAVRNASDGISLAQTGESALAELTNNLQRIRELAVQAANSTNSSSDRAALDLEVQQRLAEIERIATQTSFNGQKVLDGTFGEAKFQVGANVGETISLDLDTSMRRTSIGSVASATTVDLRTLITEESDAEVNASGASGAFTTSVAGAGGETYSITVDGETAFAFTSANAADDVTAAEIDAGIAANAAALTAAGITVTGTAAGGDLAFSRADGAAFDIVVANDMSGTAGGFAGADFVTGTNTVDNGAEAEAAAPMTIAGLTITIGDADPATVANGDYDTMQDFVDAVNTALEGNATATLDSETGILSVVSGETITIGGADAGTVFSAGSFTASGSIDTVNVLNLSTANDAIYRIDSALTSVSNLRSTFGAIQNRFESTIANLQTVSENLEASRSRILDADFASETAALTKAQILQQAGIAILAQANQAPQSVLALLQ